MFEIYQDVDAYRSHLATEHFKKVQNNDGENGEVAQADPNDANFAGYEGAVTTQQTLLS
ncbi:hypothetical protein [Bradyrhizobium sp. URHC0002]